LLLLQWRGFSRQPGVLFWAIGFPILLSLLLGVAFKNRGAQASPVDWIADSNATEEAKHFMQSLGPNDLVKVKIVTEDEARLDLKRGRTVLAVQDVSEASKRRFILDPSNSESELALRRLRAWLAHETPSSDVTYLDEKGSRYIDFVLPGLFASSIINSCLWGVAWVFIDYRQKKFLRRMIATPLKKRDFFLALFLGRCFFMLLEFGTLFSFALLLFKVSIQGSYAAFALTMFSGMLAFFGLATLIASRIVNPQVGIGVINAITLPMFLVSGMFFSYERFPAFIQPVLRYFPPTMMVDALRSVMNEGAGFMQALPASAALFAMGGFCLILGARRFRWY
jgi:ABC-type multidrug transport system permease subunit